VRHPTRELGSAAVEFALVVPLVLALAFAVVEVAVMARAQLEVLGAAREGAREAAVSTDPARAVSAARAALGPHGAEARISVRRPDVVGRPAVVTVTLPHRIGGAFFGGVVVALRASASMRVER